MKYQIVGEPLPVVICNVDAGESLITERGAMSWMTPNMQMQTQGTGGFGKMMGRMFSGDSMFQNRYTAMGGPGQIAFASSFPGSIKAYEIAPGREVIVQKRGFLASSDTVELSVFFQKRFGAGLFGGEGFIMQRLSGHGTAFIEIDGFACEYNLGPGQQMIIDTGYLAVMDATCTMDIQSVGSMKNAFLGGEGLFNTVVTGPGKIILQTMPISGVAGAISPYIITSK
ncbi:MAG: AIM24 family protein [Clostridia bacterium]|nr:AIM24 family protein [Bacillota bacterium]MBR3211757.1 AIM24 family protein [Bacillota bacterium]MCR4668057.1 AIM24 family protein [Clostridia bacterium]